MYRYLKNDNTDYISEWKSEGLLGEVIKPPPTCNNSLALGLNYIGNKTRVKFVGSCLKQDIITFTHGGIINICNAYELSISNHRYDYYPTLEFFLFGAVKLTKNSYIKRDKYSDVVVDLTEEELFHFLVVDLVVIFRVDMSSSVPIDNKKKDISVFGEGPTQGLDGTALTAEKSIQ